MIYQAFRSTLRLDPNPVVFSWDTTQGFTHAVYFLFSG